MTFHDTVGDPRSTAIRALVFFLSLFLAFRSAIGAGPADSLLRLVPADSGATLTVENLKGTFREVRDSTLYDMIRRLPVVQEWIKSDRFKRIHDTLEKVESALGERISVIRDELLGEAFVLALHVPPAGRPDEARGILLVRVTNRTLLERVVDRINSSKIARGEIRRVSDRTHQGVAYQVREAPAGGRDEEFYATLEDRVFAWSNSEALIQGAIERQSGKARGLFDEPTFRDVRDGLPGRAIAALYVNPGFAGKILAASVSNPKPEDERLYALVSRYLVALRYAGASVVWREGLVFQTREVFDKADLTPGMKRWGARRPTPDAVLSRIPDSALIAASGSIDPIVIFDILSEFVAPGDRARLAMIFEALKGVMLGLNVRDEVAAHLGPGLVAYLERPDGKDRDSRLPIVIALEIARGPSGIKAGAAVANGLRTLLAAHALDTKNNAAGSTLQSLPVKGSEVVGLSMKSPYAFALAEGRVILGSSTGAVSRALIAQADPAAGRLFTQLRKAYFADATQFLAADLKAIHDFASQARTLVSRRLAARQTITESEAARDLDQALALLELFDVAFAASRVEPGFSAVNRSIGLVRRPSASKP